MIQLRKVSVHNLKEIDLDLPYGQMIVFCGRSGSGKSSLAMDTLYAEGQRRYIESFSPYTRQFLDRLEKPDAERIDGIPAAIAVSSKSGHHISRSTVGTATETIDYMRLLFSRIGHVFCPCCGKEIGIDSPNTILQELKDSYADEETARKIQVAFAPSLEPDFEEFLAQWKEKGFIRGMLFNEPFRMDPPEIQEQAYIKAAKLVTQKPSAPEEKENPKLFKEESEDEDQTVPIPSPSRPASEDEDQDELEAETKTVSDFFLTGTSQTQQKPVCQTVKPETPPLLLVVDRLTIGGSTDDTRIIESIETAMQHGGGICYILVSGKEPHSQQETLVFSDRFSCEHCGIVFPALEPRLFAFSSPLGACPRCEGFGNLMMYDLDLIVPDPSKTIRDGAIAPWSTPSYRTQLDDFLELAPTWNIPVDIPFEQLTPAQLKTFLFGPGNQTRKTDKNTGLFGFFQRLERQKYKMHVRVFLSRWRSYRPCPDCGGTRLRAEALSVRIGEKNGRNLGELSEMTISELNLFFQQLNLSDREREIARIALEQIALRLNFLEKVGLGYLTLSRSMRTLSGGEQRRVSLTTALGSSLVDVLYVLDEPSIGLHPVDTDRLLEAIETLRDRGNTVVVVEHEEAFLRAADHLVEVGPGAGDAGGQIVFQGTTEQMMKDPQSLTGSYLSGKRTGHFGSRRRLPENGVIELIGCRGNNLKNVDVAFPLGMLCLVTGVSGAGKSSLVRQTLYPALAQHFGKENSSPGLPYDRLICSDLIEEVVMVDQTPIGRSPRSNPATYLKIFDEIRGVFAATPEAKAKQFGAGRFSFNVEGGRCEHCRGDGYIVVDMQFMADMFVPCPQCHGQRYRPEILEIPYRGRNIAEVLKMTVREAFGFFRGQSKVQQKLKRLIDVGLDYVQLGQPANMLSGGESQRLKLAYYLSQAKKGRSLFLLDEPTTGLHFADVVQLLDCFDALIETGHSLIVVEHNLQLMLAADHLIDLGPGPSDKGGKIVAQGTPEEMIACEHSVTGRFLRESMKSRPELE